MHAILIDDQIRGPEIIPSKWLREGVMCFNYNDDRNGNIWYQDGWRPWVEPEITEHQKLGDKILDTDNDVFTREVIDMTQAEIDQYEADKIRNEVLERYALRSSDGSQYYKSFQAKVVMDVDSEQITEQEAFQVEEVLVPALNKLFTGDYKSCRVYLVYRIVYSTLPTFIKPYYDKALADVNDYIDQNYD